MQGLVNFVRTYFMEGIDNLLIGITGILNFSRVFDLLVVAALMILTVIIIRNYFQEKEITQKLEKLVRDQALHDGKTKQKS